MRLQCYKPIPDEARALIAPPKLSAIYLDVPLHLCSLFPLALRLLPALLVTLSNMSVPTFLLSIHISLWIHPFSSSSLCCILLCSFPLLVVFVIANDESKKCQECNKNTIQDHLRLKISPPALFFPVSSCWILL